MCHDSQCEETAPLVRKSDFADLGVLAPTDFVKHATSHRRGAVRLAAAGEPWWCEGGGINEKLKDYFEENMQADGVPFLKDYDTYQVSFPVRELGIDPPLKLYQLPFYVRECDLDGFATSLTKRMQRPTVAYITAASHSGKSASLVVVLLKQLLRSSEGW